MKRPSFQFYPGDWLNDAALRMCSVGARGLWIDMLCIMHQGSEYGYLKVNHKVILPPNLARMVGSTLEEIEGWLSELESAGVFSKDESGCVFSRRMIRDEEIRQARAAGGIKGGNPALMSNKKASEKVGSKVNLHPNLQPTPSSSSSSSSSKDIPPNPQGGNGGDERIRKTKAPDETPYESIRQAYAEFLSDLPQPEEAEGWNKTRKSYVKARWDENPKRQTIDWWRRYFHHVSKSAFLTGKTPENFEATFDWLMKPTNMQKVIEGNYHKVINHA